MARSLACAPMLLAVVAASAALAACGSAARAAEEARSDPARPSQVAAQIDREIAAGLRARKLTAAPRAEDAEFLRRVFLDLTGRVPTADQAAAFLDSPDGDKRARLVDQLLASPEYGQHFGRVWRDWIAPAELPSEGNGGNQPIEATRNLGKWFGEQFNANRPWDAIVRAVLTVDGNLKDHPEGLFWSLVGTDEGIPEPAGATRAIGSLFVGVQLQCAECHDDPFKPWVQEDFWATAAYFRNVEATFNGRYFDSVTETFTKDGKPLAKTKGKRKPHEGDKSANGTIVIPPAAFVNAGQVVEGRALDGRQLRPGETQPLRPAFADWLLDAENPYFARAFVNRVWAYFFARGIVHPVDDFRPGNPPSHPELLALLTKEFVASGHDIKHLIRCLTASQAYHRTSRPTGAHDRDTQAAFGRHPTKLLTADQLYESLKLVLAEPKLDLRPVGAKVTGESSPLGDEYQEFCRLFETNEEDATEFIHGIPQSLALLNHPRVAAGGKRVAETLKARLEPAAAIEQYYLSALARRPTAEELRAALDFAAAAESPERAYAGLLWMLVNRTEFVLLR